MLDTFWPGRAWKLASFVLIVVLLGTSTAEAGGKVGLYAVRQEPRGNDAKDYSRPGWGGGLHVVVPVPQVQNLLAGVIGFEVVNLLSSTTEFRDRLTGLRIEQQTSQNYYRLFFGAQVGAHGHGFFRPHAGLNLAIVGYNISTDVVIPDDRNRENEIRQDLKDESHGVFGYDITLGVDLNFSNTVAVDGGVKYLKSFSVPQQLGDGSVTIHPHYFQIYLGVGVSFDTVMKKGQ
jgi:opacity protein-like surface antigen